MLDLFEWVLDLLLVLYVGFVVVKIFVGGVESRRELDSTGFIVGIVGAVVVVEVVVVIKVFVGAAPIDEVVVSNSHSTVDYIIISDRIAISFLTQNSCRKPINCEELDTVSNNKHK